MEIPIQADFSSTLAAAMFRVQFDPLVLKALEPQLTDRSQNLSLYYNIKDNQMTIGILDINGLNYVSAGTGPLVTLRFENQTTLPLNTSSLRIIHSELVNPSAQLLEVKNLKERVSAR